MSTEHNTFDSIQIGLASPEMILNWSHGEVTKPETINYRTLKPERDGLFCERIFGPTKDGECSCGKYKRVRNKEFHVCEKCGVEVTSKKVRRERMGHIQLAAPVSHIWYFRAVPSRMSLLLDIPLRALEKVLYFASYIVIDPGDTPLVRNQLLTESEYKSYYEKYEDAFRVGMGAEAIKELLSEPILNLDELSADLRAQLASASGQKKLRISKRLEVVEAFRKSGNRPEWMILDVIPVIPPDIRPMVQLDGGRFAASDLNDLYRRVIGRNNRLKNLLQMGAPDIIIRNEKRMLQEAVDALIDNGRRGKPVTGPSNRPLKSLSEMLRGKQGRFRQNLLGKRVDYSGRSVIVVGPELKIYQCGLPKEMALELFKPFVMKRLVETQKASNIKDAKKMVEKVAPEVWDALENVIKEHPVLLNRAPTLHRLSIQAFEPILVEGRAIKLHPLVCPAFNADFDGDQMPVHVPLSSEAQAEARFLMLSARNLLKPADGKAVTVPSQDMVLEPGEPGEGHVFRDFDEAVMAYENKLLGLHAPIKLRVTREIDGEQVTGIIDATLGRLIFNRSLPQDLGYVDRSDPAKKLDLEISFRCGKKQLGQLVDRCIKIHGIPETARVLDEIKSMGYKYSTRAAMSISIADITIPKKKYEIVKKAEEDVEEIARCFAEGELTEEERYNNVVALWDKATKDVVAALQDGFDDFNPIKMMSDSGARGSITQMRQLAGMRGLMFATNGRTMEIPIKSNFREGLNILEYFIAARGARKSLSDTALKTADSGYLTRRLVDVSQDVIITESDCGTDSGIVVSAIIDENGNIIEPFAERLVGRYTCHDVINPETGEVLVPANTLMGDDEAQKIIDAGIDKVEIRTILKCKSKHGVCAHCYGSDMASGKPVSIGESVGIVAAQSIGEPGTQLTMRTFHTGGVAGSNITQGLPRVEELFEARSPKKAAVIAKCSGIISIPEEKRRKIARIVPVEGDPIPADEKDKEHPIPYGLKMLVSEGDHVERGQAITEGQLAPQDITEILGLDAAYDYIIREVQSVYRRQNVDVNDRHIEVIARQMTRKVRVVDSGDTELLDASMVDVTEFDSENERIQARIDAGETELKLATSSPVLLGITKASILTESWLSAASFQETTKVLTEAAIRGKVDHLLGLKENVIIGKLIPAGTGMECYRKVEVEADEGAIEAHEEAELEEEQAEDEAVGE